jgi:hypothetical protein
VRFASPRRLRKKYSLVDSLTSAAKASTENKPVIAAINRCATQNQYNTEFFRSLLKAHKGIVLEHLRRQVSGNCPGGALTSQRLGKLGSVAS